MACLVEHDFLLGDVCRPVIPRIYSTCRVILRVISPDVAISMSRPLSSFGREPAYILGLSVRDWQIPDPGFKVVTHA